MGHARAIISIPDSNQQNRIHNLIISKNLSVRQTEQLVADLEKKQIKSSKKQVAPKLKKLEHNLTNSFSTKVEIKPLKNGKGKLVINFKSDEDLERIVNLLRNQ